jgi:hypothetical protein
MHIRNDKGDLLDEGRELPLAHAAVQRGVSGRPDAQGQSKWADWLEARFVTLRRDEGRRHALRRR